MPNHHGNHSHKDEGAAGLKATSTYELMEIALREILIEKGILSVAAIRKGLDRLDSRVPMRGAQLVARAWCDSEFKKRLLEDGSAAARELGFEINWLKLIVVENTANLHNLIVCTLCSCYPWTLIGLPPDWYKSIAYRARAVREPRAVLLEFGTALSENTEVRVHDSTADMRYMVLPERPQGTAGWTEEALCRIVSRDSMIGVARPSAILANS